MSLLIAAAALLAAAWPVDREQTFDCTLETDIITHRANGEWQVSGGGKPKKPVRYQTTRLAIRADRKVFIDLPEQAFHLSGEFSAVSTSEGIISWKAASPGQCGILDAECLATASFYQGEHDHAVLSIYVPTFAKKDGHPSFASGQFLYTCKLTS